MGVEEIMLNVGVTREKAANIAASIRIATESGIARQAIVNITRIMGVRLRKKGDKFFIARLNNNKKAIAFNVTRGKYELID